MLMLDKKRSRSRRQSHGYEEYIRRIRQCPCLICGAQAEAAHLRMSSAKYNKLNGRDHQWITPLCPNHHRLLPDSQHQGSEFDFWARHGVDALEIARKLYESKDNLTKMQEIASSAGLQHGGAT